MVAPPCDVGGFRPSTSVFRLAVRGHPDGRDQANFVVRHLNSRTRPTAHRTGRLWAVFHGS